MKTHTYCLRENGLTTGRRTIDVPKFSDQAKHLTKI